MIELFIDFIKYSNFLRFFIWGFHKLWAIIIKIITNKGLKYLTLHVVGNNIFVSPLVEFTVTNEVLQDILIFRASPVYFQNFSKTVHLFHNFSSLENKFFKFHNFSRNFMTVGTLISAPLQCAGPFASSQMEEALVCSYLPYQPGWFSGPLVPWQVQGK